MLIIPHIFFFASPIYEKTGYNLLIFYYGMEEKGITVKVPENVGEAISFPLTFDDVQREDNILPYIEI